MSIDSSDLIFYKNLIEEYLMKLRVINIDYFLESQIYFITSIDINSFEISFT